MKEPIFSPLTYYLCTAKEKHTAYAKERLHELTEKANVDRAANAQTVKNYNENQAKIATLDGELSSKKGVRTLLMVLFIVGAFIGALAVFLSDIEDVFKALILIGILSGCIFLTVFSRKKLGAAIQSLQTKRDGLQKQSDAFLNEAWQQAAPLNALFRDEDSLALFTKTLPFIVFDPYFSDTRLNELTEYGFFGGIGEEENILDALSGELYGNPFVYVQKLRHTMGTHTYHGSLTISWTVRERDSQGRTVTRTRTQTLHASIVRPKPYYDVDTALYFANEAVPNVDFSRTYAHVEDKSEVAVERVVRKGEKKIEKLEERALEIGDDFQGVANSKFDVLFGATNRTEELEFLQMFTPRAQESMLELLLYKDGYGDDFSFIKSGKICVIESEHTQGKPLFPTASSYYSHDIAAAETLFIQQNETFFRSVYFDFAPLLLIPVYQQPLVRSTPLTAGGLTAYNYESIAHKLASALQPKNADTDVIFKTSLVEKTENEYGIDVNAYAYRGENRVHYETVYGGDGRFHQVPVYWTEYVPVSRTSRVRITNEQKENGVYYRGFYAYLQ